VAEERTSKWLTVTWVGIQFVTHSLKPNTLGKPKEINGSRQSKTHLVATALLGLGLINLDLVIGIGSLLEVVRWLHFFT